MLHPQKQRLIVAATIIVAILGVAEAAVRFSGLADFALYSVDDDIGYVVKPSQAGRFLNKNNWVFNERSMGTDRKWAPNALRNVLLIGNSVVMGGNPYNQKNKLGSLLSEDLGPAVDLWPIGTGGWSTVNEVVYLRRNSDVVESTNFFIWEYMWGGLSSLSRWRGDYVFPSVHPWCASCYALRRYVLPRLFALKTNELPPTGTYTAKNLTDFETAVTKFTHPIHTGHPGIIFFYPSQQQAALAKSGREWLPERAVIEGIARRHNVQIVDLASDPNWNVSLYRDGTHPTIQGNIVMAKILARAALQSGLSANH